VIKQRLRLAVLAFPILIFSTNGYAAPLTITLDTSPLTGTQTLLFGLTNFDASSNTVLLSDFAFDGGSAVAASADCTFGGILIGAGCSGDLTTGVTLEDVDPATFFLQQFEPGASLSFALNATNNFTGPVPDQFAMFVCDAGLITCYSDDASGALLLLDLVGDPLSPASFVLFGASQEGLPAPVVTVTATTPEPGTLWLFAAAAASVAHRRRRSRPR
jgi:hypothetical protein